MNDTPNRDQLRRQFLDQAAAAFDRMFPVGPTPAIPPDQLEQRARELGHQLASCLLQRQDKSDAGFFQDIREHPDEDTPAWFMPTGSTTTASPLAPSSFVCNVNWRSSIRMILNAIFSSCAKRN
jgi:hypothetical protein